VAALDSSFQELVDIMERLRADGGCPWDREQTHSTLKRYLLEEAYETFEAIDAEDDKALCGELGDVLLQVVFHAQIAGETGRFAIDDICRAIVDKLIRRHPHVFSDVEVEDADHVVTNWERIKRAERDDGGEPPSALDGVPADFPALLRAQRIQEKASRVGFDWGDISGPLSKVKEELGELEQAVQAKAPAAGDAEPASDELEDEFGDLLFALVNAARFLKLTPEDALRRAVGKFERRFRGVEKVFADRGAELQSASLEEMDRVWDEVKKEEEERAR
jgi:tetrapyrrole methylase family protein/MazG family protein